VISRAMVV